MFLTTSRTVNPFQVFDLLRSAPSEESPSMAPMASQKVFCKEELKAQRAP